MTIKIVTDSASDLPEDERAKAGIDIVPLTVRFDDTEYVDRIELDNAKFWELLANSDSLPSTAAPSPGAFEETFRSAAENGATGVVCITLSAKLSATHQAATNAARAMEGAIDVRVIDSKSCTIGQTLLCLAAARLAEDGSDIDAIVSTIEALRERITIFATLDTLEYLKRGGRIGAAGAFFGSLLAIKPVLRIADGEVQPESRQRTRTRAIARLAKLVEDHAPVEQLAIATSMAPDVQQLIDALGPGMDRDHLLVSNIGPVIGAHGGPGILAVCFVASA